MPENRYSAIDLFCGAGGLSVGLEWAGFDIRWAIDINEKAVDTFRTNNPDVEVAAGDLQNVEFPDLDIEAPLDLVAGAPPCPTFSVVGRVKLNSLEDRSTTDDERHQLWVTFLEAVDHYRPRAFLMENVSGMVSAVNAAGQSVLSIILEEMRDLGYNVEYQVVDAANFGVPQHRERLFFIGNRCDQPIPDLYNWQTHREPDNDRERKARLLSEGPAEAAQQRLTDYKSGTETETNSEESGRIGFRQPWVTVGEAILDLPPLSPAGAGSSESKPHPPARIEEYLVPAVTDYQHWARNLDGEHWEDRTLHNHVARFHNLDDLSIYKLLGSATSWTIGGFDDELQPYRTDVFVDNYTRQSPLSPASTIDAHLHKDGHRHIHPAEARSLTVREAARLQSFRDTYLFPVSRTEAFRQVGNAVPPRLAMRIGEAIGETILS